MGPFVGFARKSPSRGILGTTPGLNHLFVGFQALVPILRVGPVRAWYGVQLIPLLMLSGPIEHMRRVWTPCPPGPCPLGGLERIVIRTVPERLYAAGISPFGFELATPTERTVAGYLEAASGGLVFTRPFPEQQGQQVNFTLEVGAGTLIRVGRTRWVQLGYRYNHLSNAYLSRSNPGLDGNVFYAGYQWTVRLPRD